MTGNVRAALDGDRTLWETLRTLADAERRDIETALSQFRALAGTNGKRPVVQAQREWEPLAFVEALRAELRERAHEQSHASDAVTESGSKAPEVAAFSLQTDDFPSLGNASNPTTTVPVTPTAVRPSAKATKRRITTTLISTDAPYAAVAVKPPVTNVTISNNDSVWSKRSLLEKRMGKTEPTTTPTEPSPIKPSLERRAALLMGDDTPPPPPPKSFEQPQGSNPWMSPPPTRNQVERNPPSLTLMGKPKKAKRVSVSANADTLKSTDTVAVVAPPLKPLEANVQAARLYGHIIVQRLVPNICSEIRFLVGLLYRRTCAATASTRCTSPNEFCHSNASASFAAAAIETLEPVLVLLGSDMVHLVAKSLEDVKLCENLVSRLRNAMEEREERRVRESAKIGCELPVEAKGTAFRDYTLPFCEDMDSRLNYRTPTESVIYSNREKTRDAFLGQLRTFQRKQNSLQGTDSGTLGSSSTAQDAQQLLQDVMPENLWWFARFFVLELVQVGSNPLGESDKDLVLKIMEDKMVVKNPDRLRKLHRRFSSQKVVDSNSNGSMSTGFQGPKSKTNNRQPGRQGGGGTSTPFVRSDKGRSSSSSDNNAVSTDNKSSVKGDAGDSSRLNDHMRSFFSDNQAFFYHFLASCDSYQFAELVKYQLEAQFLSIWRAKPNADPRKEFTETVLRLKTLAKFIGYLRFSPQWHWSALTSALSAKNPALEAAQREAVKTLEQSQSANAFDIVGLLEESIVSRTVAKCIPWLCDFLSMLSSDVLASSTRYVQRALLLMAYVHRSRMVDTLGETGLFVALQIERLFQLLAAHELVPPALIWCQSLGDKPPAWMRTTTVQALLAGNDGSGADHHTDHLPFLYSSMFVQVCVSELDDLRGYIQTRSNPHHRVAGTRRGNLPGSKALSIRKVRPLQVVSEEHLEASTSTADADNNVPSGCKDSSKNETIDDPLREAFFKLYPQLKRAVEFVVDMVVTNVCEHAVSKYVKPNADALIDSCVDDAKANAPAFTQLILHGFQVRLDERLEDFMTTSVTNALQEARELCIFRVEAALRPLVAPSVPAQLVSAATKIAQAQAEAAITNLITRSLQTEFLKRVAVRKRAIVKEAGSISTAGPSPGDESSGTDDSTSKDSIARALKFSFDDSGDPEHTPLEEALHLIKTNVVAINGLLQSRREERVTTRTLGSFVRFERGFRGALEHAIEELAQSEEQVQRNLSVLLWSWIWRGLRLSLKLFVSLITGATSTEGVETKTLPDVSRVGDFVTIIAKTLNVMAKLQRDPSDESPSAPVTAICRFVALSANTVRANLPREPTTDDEKLQAQACLTLHDHAIALCSASTPNNDSPHGVR